MAFSKKITLYDEERGYGVSTKAVQVNRKTVWCSIENVGTLTSVSAMAANVKLTSQVEMWAREYGGQQYAEFGGIKYKVESSNKTGSALVVKLLLSRG